MENLSRQGETNQQIAQRLGIFESRGDVGMMAFIGLQVGLNANGCHQTVDHQRQLVIISGLKVWEHTYDQATFPGVPARESGAGLRRCAWERFTSRIGMRRIKKTSTATHQNVE